MDEWKYIPHGWLDGMNTDRCLNGWKDGWKKRWMDGINTCRPTVWMDVWIDE